MPVGVGTPVTGGTAAGLITQALELAGNTQIPQATALDWLNNFLQAEYRRKYWWQRLTATFTTTADVAAYASAWPSTFLDTFEHDDGTVGRYPDSLGGITTLRELTYRQYIGLADRATARGAPTRIVADPVGATWYVYPLPDRGYAISVDYYQLPAVIAAGDTPLWSTYAPVDILVQAIKTMAMEHMADDDRYIVERSILYGDAKTSQPGMLATYRRRTFSDQGVSHQTALDQRKFLVMPVAD